MSVELKIARILEGQNVVIIGGADKISDRISEYDFHVHINNHWSKHEGRCDAIYHNCNFDIPAEELLSTLNEIGEGCPGNPQYIVGNRSQPGNDFCRLFCEKRGIPYHNPSRKLYAKTNPFGCQYEWFNALRKSYTNFVPLSGIVALEHIRMHNVKSIFVTGMTMYHDGKEFKKKVGAHDIKQQINYLKYVREVDSRVTYDLALGGLF